MVLIATNNDDSNTSNINEISITGISKNSWIAPGVGNELFISLLLLDDFSFV